MCDDITEAENEDFLSKRRLSRREAIGAGAAAAILTGCAPAKPPAGVAPPDEPPPDAPAEGTSPETAPAERAEAATSSRMVTVETPDGQAEAFFVAPKNGKHPGVVMWPDVAGLREAYEKMATRLAGEGYAVLAVNPYYRSAKLPILATFDEWRTEEGRTKIAPMREALTPEAVARDGAAFAAWLDAQPEVDPARKLAGAGYCMSGSYTLRMAAAVPKRVGAAASFHGGGLVTDEPTSPHRLFSEIEAAVLICIAQNDDERDPEAKSSLRQAADAAGVQAEIEVYPAQHGWCTIDSPVYDEAQAERAWARMLDTFARNL